MLSKEKTGFLAAAMLILAAFAPFFSCAKPLPAESAPQQGSVALPLEAPQETLEEKPPLSLTFLGDIMAHTPNHETPDYSWIYQDVAPFLLSDDLTFANFEMPLSPSIPKSSYPKFNAHPPYLEAAAEGGCDVFSLANNHINDHGVAALLETIDEFSRLLSEGKIAGFSGLRRNPNDALQPFIIEKKGWKILYLAATQILNEFNAAAPLVYFFPPTQRGRDELKRELIRMKSENTFDLFVLALHVNEPEYVIEVSEEKRVFFRELALECGVDIIWAHHPHVSQAWELIPRGEGERPAFAIYSAGNFISSQRYKLNTENPADAREYTGDAFIFRVVLTEKNLTIIPVLVTNYRDTSAPVGSRDRYFTVRHFNSCFIEGLKEEEKAYYEARFALMQEFLKK